MKRLIIVAAVSLLASTSLEAQLRTTDELSELANAVKILRSQVSALETKNSQLTNRVTALETQVAQLSAQSNTVGFTKSGSTYTLDALGGSVVIKGGQVTVESTGNFVAKASATASVEGTTLNLKGLTSARLETSGNLLLKGVGTSSLETAAVLDLKGSLIRLNGGARPVLSQPVFGVSPAGPVTFTPQASTILVP